MRSYFTIQRSPPSLLSRLPNSLAPLIESHIATPIKDRDRPGPIENLCPRVGRSTSLRSAAPPLQKLAHVLYSVRHWSAGVLLFIFSIFAPCARCPSIRVSSSRTSDVLFLSFFFFFFFSLRRLRLLAESLREGWIESSRSLSLSFSSDRSPALATLAPAGFILSSLPTSVPARDSCRLAARLFKI